MQEFYGGDPDAWWHLSMWKLKAFIDRLNALRADRQLRLIEATAFPHMDSRGRANTLRQLNRVIAPQRPIIAGEADLAALGIPVIKVRATPEG